MNNITSPTRAQIIAEALPFMQNYNGEYVVVKYGGHAMGDRLLSNSFAQNIVMLKQAGMKPVVVHGGGPQIGEMLNNLGIKSQFVNGLRITDKKTTNKPVNLTWDSSKPLPMSHSKWRIPFRK